MDTSEYEFLEFRFSKLYSYCSAYDKSNEENLFRRKITKLADVFVIDIACYLLYLSPSSRKLLNELFLFRDAMDCNRLVLDQMIEIVRQSSISLWYCFEKPLIVQILSYENLPESEEYAALFLDFFRLLGNAVIRTHIT